jgi:hypothetical protein
MPPKREKKREKRKRKTLVNYKYYSKYIEKVLS